MLPFGIGFGELVIIALVVLLVVGPKDMPKIAQELGKNVRKARRMLAQIQDSAEVDEIKRAVYGEGPKPAWQRPEPLMRPPVVVDPPPPPTPVAPEPTETTPSATPEAAPAHAGDPHEADDGAPVARLSGPAAAVARAEAEAVAAPAPAPLPRVEP